MSRYNGGWPSYVPVAERRRKAAREIDKLRKRGHPIAPVTIEGRAIATTFWGKAWCTNLESYGDYESRLPRGRTYVRNGSVVDLQIGPLGIKARVSGSSIYTVTISVGALSKLQWQSICSDCAGGIDSLVELLQGRFSKGVMERICRQANGLFPKPSEIRFSCSCPDYASMCKHVAAVLYGVGARLDERPELLFRLRAVNENDLVANIDQALPLVKKGPVVGKVLETDDVSAIFGLDMAGTVAAVEAGNDAQTAAGQPVTRAGPFGANRKDSRQRDFSADSKTTRRSEPLSKRAVPKKAAARKPVAAAAQKTATARDPASRAKTSGHPGDAPAKKMVAKKNGASANSAGKAASAAKAREPQPVKWWLPSSRAKAHQS
jgi:uncharacterized Zn finger protein